MTDYVSIRNSAKQNWKAHIDEILGIATTPFRRDTRLGLFLRLANAISILLDTRHPQAYRCSHASE